MCDPSFPRVPPIFFLLRLMCLPFFCLQRMALFPESGGGLRDFWWLGIVEEASIIIAANQEIINVNLHCLLPLYQELILVRQCNISFKVWDWKTTLKVTKMLHHLNITFSGEGANRASLETSNEKSNTAFSFCVRFSSAGVYHLPPPRNALCILLLGWRPCCIFNWWHSGLGCNSEYEC